MRLYFKQRMFSWLDSYDVFDEYGNTFCQVKGQLAWGHCLKLFDVRGNEIGTVRERPFSILPKFELYIRDQYIGMISRQFTFFRPVYQIDCRGWHVEGSVMQWEYSIYDCRGNQVAQITKELFQWTDTYVIDVADSEDALVTIMLVLAIDAEKCSHSG